MNARERIVVLLRWYADVTSTLQRGDSGGQFVPESRLFRMPAVYSNSPSYRDLDLALVELREEDRPAYVAVLERYIVVDRRSRVAGVVPGAARPTDAQIRAAVRRALRRHEELLVGTTTVSSDVLSEDPKWESYKRRGIAVPKPTEWTIRYRSERWRPDLDLAAVERGLDYLERQIEEVWIPNAIYLDSAIDVVDAA